MCYEKEKRVKNIIRTHRIKRTIGKVLAVIIAFVVLAGMVPFCTAYAAATSAGNETALRTAANKGGDVKTTKSILLTEAKKKVSEEEETAAA